MNCHNTHPQTPRSGWKTGDLRGILEASLNVADRTTATAGAGTFWLIVPGFTIAALILLAFFRRLQRLTVTLEEEVEE